ncbi:cytochrome c oxidase subunit 7A2, mitochondrial-like [Branchiostoma floridae]|uniref:Cytochrome c oxidase subunit 7A2, mitochondrial-like n=1 Tax=Branchiostoma floridae TaxID=7739 RepID=A0A9J7L4Z6_BRAFL|nr:cytochrome c oxidase subunit 7A2, mitochondrial-like [Branchiostoma floridae]
MDQSKIALQCSSVQLPGRHIAGTRSSRPGEGELLRFVFAVKGRNDEMNRVLAARSLVQRAGFSTSTRKALDNKVLEKQKIMQAPGGDMVYLKGGASDKIYYRTTMGMVIFGVGYSIFSLLAACLPKKSE